MKFKDITNIINDVISEEVKKTILMESKEVYHITCEGEPVSTHENEEDANRSLEEYKKAHPKKEFLIDKATYESEDDMINKLDEMGGNLEEKENTNMENLEPMEGNAFTLALDKAKDAGEKKFTVDGQEYDVEECWKQLEEEEGMCDECGDGYMEEEEECSECGGGSYQMNEQRDYSAEIAEFNDIINQHKLDEGKCPTCDQPAETCECGSGMYETEEPKKKTIRLSEEKFLELVSKIVAESVPGLDAVKKAHNDDKETKENLSRVDKAMKDYLSFDGNDNPEFPKQIGKGEKMAVNNTEKEDEYVEDFRGGGMQDLDYDEKPSPEFIERLKKSLNGDRTMGNAAETEATKGELSNGGEMGEESKHKTGNTVKTKTGEKMFKAIERKHKLKDEAPMYNKDAAPIKTVGSLGQKHDENLHEGVEEKKVVLEEIERMKKMYNYNKKTQS